MWSKCLYLWSTCHLINPLDDQTLESPRCTAGRAKHRTALADAATRKWRLLPAIAGVLQL
jgi:hypothetical protein